MADNDFFSAQAVETENKEAQTTVVPEGEKKTYVPSIALGISGALVGVILIPLIGLILSIIGVTLANKNKLTANTTPGLICSIIGIAGSIGMWIYSAVVIVPQMMG